MNNSSLSGQPLPRDNGELKERLVEVGLSEILSGDLPPDYTQALLKRLDETAIRPQPLHRDTAVRRAAQVSAFLAAAACLLLLLRFAEDHLQEFAKASERVAAVPDFRQNKLATKNFTPARKGSSEAGMRDYTVMVPEQRSREESYTVMSAEPRQRTQSYTVMVPENRQRSEQYTVPREGRFSSPQGANTGLHGTPVDGEIARKIRYNSTLNLVVDQFDGVIDRVNSVVARHDGYVGQTNLGQMRGEQRSGSWTIRIPVGNYQAFLQEVDEIGILDARHESAQDVTVQFTDLERRIENKKKLEERIIKLLERPDDELKHVIEVERELARIRSEVEGLEGQRQVMLNQTSLATITLHVREERDYVPPTVPTVGSRLGNAWSNGFARTGNFFMNLAIWFIERLIPIVICLIVAFFLLRWLRSWRAMRKLGAGS